jgi:hypothetical protein
LPIQSFGATLWLFLVNFWGTLAPCEQEKGSTMVRHKRLMLRLYFVLVIGLALFGGWYASNNWQIETDAISAINMQDEVDWVDFFAALGEGAIQLFLGFTTD